jgi:hypothetical protein
LLLAATALAQDKRVQLLQKQLSGSKDARLRAQIASLLGKTGSGDAVQPLCGLLSDRENIVRIAAAQSLGELGTSDAIPCLKSAQGDAEGALARQIQRALDALKPSGGLYVAIDVEGGSLASDVVNYAYEQLKKEVSALGATVAPRGETKSEASSAVKSHGYRGFLMKTKLSPNGASGLKVEVLIMTWPAEALQGNWNVKAAGGKPEAQLKAMVPRVVNDAATDLEWK